MDISKVKIAGILNTYNLYTKKTNESNRYSYEDDENIIEIEFCSNLNKRNRLNISFDCNSYRCACFYNLSYLIKNNAKLPKSLMYIFSLYDFDNYRFERGSLWYGRITGLLESEFRREDKDFESFKKLLNGSIEE